MLDDATLRKKVFWRLLGSPGTVFPFMLGMTAMTASWALDWMPGIGIFTGLAGVLVAAGTFCTRLFLSGDKVARQVLQEADQSSQQARQQALDALDRQLTTSDNDPRPETALRDLRALVKAFDDNALTASRTNIGQSIEIQSRVGLLFDQCVESLQQTERLWQVSRQLHTPAARQPILNQREKLIEDVQGTIKQISDTLVALQRLGAGKHSNAELSRLRDELDQSLAVAKAVEERVNTLVNETALISELPPRQQQT
ncbi:MAG: hypothetical protein HZA90_25065 [Verrucomicrobia bacterium]|nr:hypothetical protein [Verrucomicrobiota bacterium]